MIFQEGTTIVFQWTYPSQIQLVAKDLVQRYTEIREQCLQEEKDGGFVTPLSDELDQLVNAYENILSDFECDGFEREEAPRYMRWLEE